MAFVGEAPRTAQRRRLFARSSLRSVVARGAALGLCFGLVAIGLLENLERFADPAALHAQARIGAAGQDITDGRTARLLSENPSQSR